MTILSKGAARAAAAASFVLFAGAASAQTYLGSISTNGYGQNFYNPFGLKFGPGGDLYVSLCGQSTFGDPNLFNNNVVIRINPANNQVVATIPCQLFPEEIAFATPPGGSTIGLVTNSTSGSVTVFDVATDSLIANVSLPGGFFGEFPFGVITNSAGTLAYVANGGGAGVLRAIDIDPASGTVYQHLPGSDVLVPGANSARLSRVGDNIICPSTEYTISFSGSTASIDRFAIPPGTATTRRVVIGHDNSFTKYPSAQDTELAPDGLVYVCGYDLSKRIYGFDPTTGMLARSFPSGTSGGSLTGLAVSPDGRVLVACDLASNEIAFLDLARGIPLAVIDTVGLGFGFFGPNDAAFSPDGLNVYVTVQFSEAVLRFAAPVSPTPFAPPLAFSVSPTDTLPGGPVTLQTSGVLPSEFVAILADDFDMAVDFGPFGVLHVTESATTLTTANGTDASLVASAPNDPLLFGKNYLCQAIAVDFSAGTFRLSEEIPVVIQ